jgi:hypothetical protein
MNVRGMSAKAVLGLAVVSLNFACGKSGPLDDAKVVSSHSTQVDGLNLTVQEVETPADVKASVAAAISRASSLEGEKNVQPKDGGLGDGLDSANVIVDKVINLGKKVWKVIADNQPVLNLKFDFANALPQGVKAATDLAGFSELQFKSFVYSGTNGFGAEVFKVQYTVVYQFGGAYSGKGAYINAASVVPQDVSVLWGYDLGMDVQNVAVSNIGTSESPVASMTLMAHIKVSTVLKKTEINELFSIRGDNGMLTRAN